MVGSHFMAIFTIAGLTIREAARRRTLPGILLLGMLVLGMSLLLYVIRRHMEHLVAIGVQPEAWMNLQLPFAQSAIMSLCLSCIKALGAIVGALVAGGSISSEIDRGVLAAVVPRPIPRSAIVLGKWLGNITIATGASLIWSAILFASMTVQLNSCQWSLLIAGIALAVYPVLTCSLALMLSTVAPRLLGALITLAVCAISWFDGILSWLGSMYSVPLLHKLAILCGLLLPQGYVGYWVDSAVRREIILPDDGPRSGWKSPQYLNHIGSRLFDTTHLDALYVTLYITTALALAVVLFNRRDIN